MRTAAALSLLGLCSCTSLTMAEPQIHVSPYLAVYQLRGTSSVQSEPSPGLVQDNRSQPMRTFGQDHHREDVGVRVDIGDGFGGFRADYYRLDMGTGGSGALDADWGRLLAGDVVRMTADMDEVRVGYEEPLLDLETDFRDHPLRLRCAIGAVVAHRELNLRAATVDGVRQQRLELEGDVAYPAVRARLSWREVSLDVDYAAAPDAFVLGGDWDGMQQDLEVRLAYTLPMRDVTFFGGYRYSEFPATGDANGFRYDADLRLDGYQFGLVLTF
ncbi:MAG: hypothetical protein JNL08_07505 [Planctomycetes bacterium]|nr:hypothetical protein [Planctomycetota bacterium]